MGRAAVVRAEVVRLPLAEGDYIDVKRRLNVGEQSAMFERMVKSAKVGEKPDMNVKSSRVARVAEYLVAWSFTAEDGKTPLAYSLEMSIEARTDTLNAIDPDIFAEVEAAIAAHEAAIDKEMEARKNAKGGATESAAITPSAA